MTKERKCGRSPTQETLGIFRGGGIQSSRPTNPAEDPPTQTPPLCNLIFINEAWSGVHSMAQSILKMEEKIWYKGGLRKFVHINFAASQFLPPPVLQIAW